MPYLPWTHGVFPVNAVDMDGVTKIYRLYGSPRDRVREWLSLGRDKRHREFYALRGVSLSVRKGETVGIIGQNGSGKSSILKILSGVTRPSSGRVEVNGRVSSLLELGAGFNPEFTGRDNVYMNGALMGFSKQEMVGKFSEISAFADIGEFIDQPVRTYSSGMYMRLAFSAAINVDPDILVIDEILSVGDQQFQSKCRRKIQELRHGGKTVLLVSHDMFTIENLCGRVYLLDHGKVVAEGKPADVLPVYRKILHGDRSLADGYARMYRDDSVHGVGVGEPANLPEFKRWGTRDVEITRVYFSDGQEKQGPTSIVKTMGSLLIRIEYTAHRRILRPVFGAAIERSDGIELVRSSTRWSRLDVPEIEGPGVIEYVVKTLPLLPGKFFFSASVTDYDVFTPYDLWHRCLSFSVEGDEATRERAGIFCLDNEWRAVKE